MNKIEIKPHYTRCLTKAVMMALVIEQFHWFGGILLFAN